MPSSSPFAAFAFPSFRYFQVARFLSILGLQMQGVAIGWHVYAMTRDPLHLGYVGLAQFLPSLLLWLFTGHVADRVDRRWVVAICHAALALSALGLALEGYRESPRLATLYALLGVVGTARAFLGPSAAALLPNLVPREVFPNAVAWNSSTWQVATIAGPSLGGVAYAVAGSAPPVYAACAGLEALTVLMLLGVRARSRQREEGSASWQRLVAGLVYIRRRPVVLGAVSLDLFAVLFGGAVALLPVYASDVLAVGPWGLGVLRSAPGVGAAVTALVLAWFPVRRHAGRLLFACVGAFGLATLVFALSTRFALSVAALVAVGASDMVSVFVRQNVVQLATPDTMRGRVSAVNLLFIGASNELGELESGLTAHWLGTVPAAALGGVGTLLVVALWALLFPDLRRVDRLDRLEPDEEAA